MFNFLKPSYEIKAEYLYSPVSAINGERVRDWVDRFYASKPFTPNCLDFILHGQFLNFRFIDPFTESWDGDASLMAKATEICVNHYDERDWYITADGSVWFRTEEELMLFKLYW